MAVVLFAKTCFQPASQLVILANNKAETLETTIRDTRQRYDNKNNTTTRCEEQRNCFILNIFEEAFKRSLSSCLGHRPGLLGQVSLTAPQTAKIAEIVQFWQSGVKWLNLGRCQEHLTEQPLSVPQA